MSIKSDRYYNEKIGNSYGKIYKIFIQNKYSDWDTFFKNLIDNANFTVSIKSLRTIIEEFRYSISERKASQMSLILDYQIAMRDNKLEKASKLKEKIEWSIIKCDYLKKKEKDISSENPKRIISILKDLNIVLKTRKKPEELFEEGLIKTEHLEYDLKMILNSIDSKKYIEFLMITNDLNPITETELKQCIEVLRYFCDNLRENIEVFKNYNVEENEYEIRNFRVDSEEEFSKERINDIGYLYNCKKLRLKSILNTYEKLLNRYEKIYQAHDLREHQIIDTPTIRTIEKEYPFLVESYKKIRKTCNFYKFYIKEVKHANKDKEKELQEEYLKRLYLRDNN